MAKKIEKTTVEIPLKKKGAERVIRALQENLSYYKTLGKHKKQHPRGKPCQICKEYGELVRTIQKLTRSSKNIKIRVAK